VTRVLILNHLNIAGPMHDIDKIATAFMWGQPFSDLCPVWPRENDRHEGVLDARRKAWGTTDEAMQSQVIDVFPNSAAIEFLTVGTEPDKFIAFLSRSYPQVSGVCQFHMQANPLVRSGIINISGGRTFARNYIAKKEYA
jgi:hypothetical protein